MCELITSLAKRVTFLKKRFKRKTNRLAPYEFRARYDRIVVFKFEIRSTTANDKRSTPPAAFSNGNSNYYYHLVVVDVTCRGVRRDRGETIDERL